MYSAFAPNERLNARLLLDLNRGAETARTASPTEQLHVTITVQQALSRGGQATTWLVTYESGAGKQDAVLKIAGALEGIERSRSLQSLVEEAKVLGKLPSDGIVRLLALVQIGDDLGLVTAFQQGTVLEKLVEQRALTSDEARSLGLRLLEVLGPVHKRDVSHADIKPSNVVIPNDPEGRPDFRAAVLIDFGLSHSASLTPEQQKHVGTIGWIPHERSADGPQPIDDVWAVGMLLFRALYRTQPWSYLRGKEPETIVAWCDALATHPSAPIAMPLGIPWQWHAWKRFFNATIDRGSRGECGDLRNRSDQLREEARALQEQRRIQAIAFLRAVPLRSTLTRLALIPLLAVLVLGLASARYRECPTGQIRCGSFYGWGGTCIDPLSDEHCGACGAACSNSAGLHCSRDEINVPACQCPAGLALCAGRCVTLASDEHCGRCETSCNSSAGEHCLPDGLKNVQCACPRGQRMCGGRCVDVAISQEHCGECDHACGNELRCDRGVCRSSCSEGRSWSAELRECVDGATDPRACGTGTRLRACAAGEHCVRGTCTPNCPLDRCGNACVDTQNDPSHCGSCGRACRANEFCVQGSCTSRCPTGQTLCDGLCRDTTTDRLHCGRCANPCDAGQVCVRGSCTTSCPTGQSVCGGQCVSVDSDRRHCGSCGNACERGQVCTAGACQTECATGQTRCGDSCVDLDANQRNCGRCGNSCGPVERCENGTCHVACGAQQASCDGLCANLQSDQQHCGRCDRVCSGGQTCVSGACICPSWLSFCDGRCVDLQHDPAHCGSCTNSCPGGSLCDRGECTHRRPPPPATPRDSGTEPETATPPTTSEAASTVSDAS